MAKTGTGNRSIVDGQAYDYKVFDVDAKRDQAGEQKSNRDGLPGWSVELLRTEKGESGQRDLISATVYSSSRPAVEEGQKVAVEGLIMGFWESGNRSGVFYSADSIKAAGNGRPTGLGEVK